MKYVNNASFTCALRALGGILGAGRWRRAKAAAAGDRRPASAVADGRQRTPTGDRAADGGTTLTARVACGCHSSALSTCPALSRPPHPPVRHTLASAEKPRSSVPCHTTVGVRVTNLAVSLWISMWMRHFFNVVCSTRKRVKCYCSLTDRYFVRLLFSALGRYSMRN